MSDRLEKILLIIASICLSISLLLVYAIGLQWLSNPDLAQYITEAVMYISGLVVLRGIWKQTLDKKISSRKNNS
ncbi:MAG: hypothetical protein JJ978_17305 [Roseivirga sp.]|jgi:hypothetical protein|uniref:hypothetical protein n=1 Tax=Roseivirga sp. TaxID=1964215 RepID=UPI001B176A21|nr:hypothetical protein [Roseivirga sp.]MBO6497326.1 hypothetical protein [Roseivirga sp.]